MKKKEIIIAVSLTIALSAISLWQIKHREEAHDIIEKISLARENMRMMKFDEVHVGDTLLHLLSGNEFIVVGMGENYPLMKDIETGDVKPAYPRPIPHEIEHFMEDYRIKRVQEIKKQENEY